jgi:hypothetical protein
VILNCNSSTGAADGGKVEDEVPLVGAGYYAGTLEADSKAGSRLERWCDGSIGAAIINMGNPAFKS